MRYFTRQVYQEYGDGMMHAKEGYGHHVVDAQRKWNDASKRYLGYLSEHSHQFTEAVRRLASYNLHDAILKEVDIHPHSVDILLDTRGAPVVPSSEICIFFLHVRDLHGFAHIVGEAILYEELYVHDEETFEYSALCTKSECSLLFGDVIVRDGEEQRRRV